MNLIRSKAPQAARALVPFTLAALLAACSGTQIVGLAATPQAQIPTLQAPVSSPAAVAPGTWTGTVVAKAVINHIEDESGDSGDDPNSAYYTTFVRHDSWQADVTDTFNINAHDEEDLTYGIHVVDLAGTASASGSEDLNFNTKSNDKNSGCTWKTEDGETTTGSWNSTARAVGEMRFSEDGSYSIDIRADNAGPNGEVPEGPQLAHHWFEKITDLSAGCSGEGYDNNDTQEPLREFASSLLGAPDLNLVYSTIEGNLPTSNTGSTVDGTSTWQLRDPVDDTTLTLTWHLVHSSPIVLPHS